MPHVCIVSLNGYALFRPHSCAQVGGTEVQLYLLGQELEKRQGYRVSYVVGDFGQAPRERYGAIDVYRSIRLDKRWINLLVAPWILWRELAHVSADVYISSPAGPEVGVIALFCRLFRKKYIYRTASSVDCTYEKARDLGLVGGGMYVLGVLLAHQLVTQSTTDQKNLQNHFNRRAGVLPNGIDIPPARIASEADGQYLLWVGSARTVKQPKLFLEIAKRFPDQPCYMVISSAGDKQLREKIYAAGKRIANLTIIENVRYTEMQSYFDKARVYIGTSAYEGFPNVYLEACVSGVPIVSLNVNPDSFITRYNVGYCAQGDMEKVCYYVNKLLKDDQDYHEKSKNAFEYVRRVHAISRVASAWTSLVEQP